MLSRFLFVFVYFATMKRLQTEEYTRNIPPADQETIDEECSYQGNGADVDVHPLPNEKPLACEVKARRNGAGFATLEKWLGEFDALFLRRDNAEPLAVVPWRVWARLVGKR